MKKFLFLLPCVVFFAGCGEIELVDALPTPTPTISTIPSPTSENTASTTPAACEDVQKERDNLSEAITKMQEELQSCLTEKDQFASVAQTAEKTVGMDEKFIPLIQKYLTQVPQKEFPFTPGLCGGLGTVTGKSWYAEFDKALIDKNIAFAALSRPLKAADFGGVCASEEGKIAIFVGAKAENKSEFHMVKYHLETKMVEPVVLLSGTCDVCPQNFGKRIGPVITLTGSNGQKNFDYYYDANVVVTK